MSNTTPIIGLEVHVELCTQSKMFCGCSAEHFNVPANTHTCPVCLGLPGALPVPNQRAIEDTIKIGLALNCSINHSSHFDRKQYFYPDLPKGYQISQYQQPLCYEGYLTLDSGKKIRIERVHLEEDTGKLQHTTKDGRKVTLVDYNRSSVPLVEIVSYPDMSDAEEAKEYLKKVHQIIRTLGVSGADMEKGQMRLEPTVNVRIIDGERERYTPLVEIKNINSFNFAAQAINYEVDRLISEFEKTGIEKNSSNKSTRGYDNARKVTFPQRQKEEAKDYRYFPEPDIPPLEISTELIESLKSSLPELPEQKIDRLVGLGIEKKYSQTIVSDPLLYQLVFSFVEDQEVSLQKLANLLVNRKINIAVDPSPENVKRQYSSLTESGDSDESRINAWIDEVISSNSQAVIDYNKGKTNVLGFLIGQVMKLSLGKANPQVVNKLMVEKLQQGQ